MSKKVVVVLAVIALVLALVVAGAVGFLWYRNTHVFGVLPREGYYSCTA